MVSSAQFGRWCMYPLILVYVLSGLVRAQTESSGRPPVWLVPSHAVIERQLDDAMVITCHSDEGHDTLWLNPHKKQIVSNRGRIHVELTQANSYSLVFESIRTDDKGNYTCKTTVDGKDITKHFRLTVIVPTTFNDTPAIQEAEVEQDMTLHCFPKGDPRPEVRWHFKGKAVDESKKYKIVENGLLIRKVSVEDSGMYECKAYQISNFSSTIREFKITVRIQHKPTIQAKEGSSDLVHGYRTGTVNLTCRATAEPKPKFEWMKDGKRIVPNDNVVIYNEEHSSTLELELTNISMFGDYECKAINKLGTTERVIVLREGDQPESPKSITDLHATSDSIQMKITPPEGGILPITGFRIQYIPKHSDSTSWEDANVLDVVIEDDGIYVLQGLSQDTEYVIRVHSRNAAGFSVPSEEKTIRTHKIQANPVKEPSSAVSNIPSSVLALVINIISLRHLL